VHENSLSDNKDFTMKHLILGICLASCASAASAANWGEFAWGEFAWGAGIGGGGATPIPIDSPVALLGLTVALASAAVWYLRKQR